jgi:spermidine synthase
MKQQPPKALTPPQHRYLLAALFVTGATTLALEVAGTRLLSPYYGSSLYTWSSIITVTLISLAAGYSLGGRLADRGASLLTFSRALCWAAMAVALVPALRAPVLKATSPLGVQLGTLASATALVAPALIIISCLGPIAIRLTALGLETVGRKAGDVYALSTIGSVTGAVLTGFVLVPRLPLTQIFYGAAVLLLLLGALGIRLSAQKIPYTQLAAAAAAALLGFWPRTPPASTNIVVNRESAYGQIKVVDSDVGLRYLMVNGTSQSVASRTTGESDSQYVHGLEWAALLRPQAKRALVVGLGAGLIPGAYERVYDLTTDVAEIDPDMVRAAKEQFAYAPRGDVFVEDGRVYVERTGRRYDALVVDAFGSESPPYHLFTRESFVSMKRAMQPGGVLAVNMVSAVSAPGNEPWLSVYKTLAGEFGDVRAYVSSDRYRDIGNVLLFASDSPLELKREPKLREVARADIKLMLSQQLRPSSADLERVPLLTDDYAPLEFLLARTAGIWRRSLVDQISELMLY